VTVSSIGILVTVLMPVVFIGIVVWAYSRKRAKAFAEAAMLPFADEERPAQKNPHGQAQDQDKETSR
jgi:cytochrome c oxidase cbb3-type subunit IV